MATKPTESYDWAVNLIFNGPTAGPNKIDVPAAYEQQGWLWNQKPAYEIMNGWMYSVTQWLNWTQTSLDDFEDTFLDFQDQIDQLNIDITGIPSTTSESFTIGQNAANDNPKYFYATTSSGDTDFQSYIVLRRSPEYEDPSSGDQPWLWWAKNSENSTSIYSPSGEYPLDPSLHLIPTISEIRLIADEQIALYHTGEVNVYSVDVRYLGNTTQGIALSTAEATISNPLEGDKMTVIWLLAGSKYAGNYTKVTENVQVNNYVYSNGAWV